MVCGPAMGGGGGAGGGAGGGGGGDEQAARAIKAANAMNRLLIMVDLSPEDARCDFGVGFFGARAG
jgi:hypothetical protein